MTYEIPIIDREGNAACKALWEGELYHGEFTIIAYPGLEENATNVIGMIEKRTDINDVKYHSEGDDNLANGWHTYEGFICGLRIVLPSLGFSIGHIGGITPDVGLSRVAAIEAAKVNFGIE